LIPGPTQPSTAANPISQSVSPATIGTTSQATIEGARLPGNQKRSFEGIEQLESGHDVRRFQLGPTPLKQGTHKRLQKVWKPKLRHPKLILGMDVGLSEACNLALCALVGRLDYKEKCKQNFDVWIANH
jgi:hypothetical protein